MLASSLIDLAALGKILLVGLAAGAGVVVAFGFVLLGRSRYAEVSSDDRLARGGYLVMVAGGAAFCAAALILGFIAMTHK